MSKDWRGHERPIFLREIIDTFDCTEISNIIIRGYFPFSDSIIDMGVRIFMMVPGHERKQGFR
jgi:hypothetical protein